MMAIQSRPIEATGALRGSAGRGWAALVAHPLLRQVCRWALSGGGSLLLQLALQGVLITALAVPARLGIVLAYEVALVAHYYVNDRWVFGQRHPSWRRLVAFHASALTAEAVTLAVALAVLSGPAAVLLGPA